MSEQENIRTAEKSITAINAHNLNQAIELYTADYQAESPGIGGGLNLEQSQANTQGFIDAFPDLHFDINRRIAQDDFVVLHWTSTGTNTGSLRTPSGNSIPPTGKKGAVSGATIYQFRDGKISRSWTYWDSADMLVQLGLMPAM